MRQGEDFEVTITMENPLEVQLTECELEIEGPGTQKSMELNIKYVFFPPHKPPFSYLLLFLLPTAYILELLSTACRRQCRDNREFSTVDMPSLLCRQKTLI